MKRKRHGTIGVMTMCLALLQTPLVAAAQPTAYQLAIQQRICRTRPAACRLAHASSSSSSAASSASIINRFGVAITSAQWNALIISKHRSGGHQPSAQSSSSSAAPIVLVAPSITLGDITKNYGDTAFTLTPTTNSSGTLTYDSSDPSVATISGNTVTITGAGTTVITLTQAANGTYTSGTTTATLTVNRIAPTIAAISNITKMSTDLPFTVFNPFSNSGGAFSYTSSNPSVASISGNTVSIHGLGTTTITVTQAASGNYTSGTRTFTISVVDLSEA